MVAMEGRMIIANTVAIAMMATSAIANARIVVIGDATHGTKPVILGADRLLTLVASAACLAVPILGWGRNLILANALQMELPGARGEVAGTVVDVILVNGSLANATCSSIENRIAQCPCPLEQLPIIF